MHCLAYKTKLTIILAYAKLACKSYFAIIITSQQRCCFCCFKSALSLWNFTGMMDSFSIFTGILMKSLKKSSVGGILENQVSFLYCRPQGHSQASHFQVKVHSTDREQNISFFIFNKILKFIHCIWELLVRVNQGETEQIHTQDIKSSRQNWNCFKYRNAMGLIANVNVIRVRNNQSKWKFLMARSVKHPCWRKREVLDNHPSSSSGSCPWESTLWLDFRHRIIILLLTWTWGCLRCQTCSGIDIEVVSFLL